MSSKADFLEGLSALLPKAGYEWTGRLGGMAARVAADWPAPLKYLDQFAQAQPVSASLEVIQVTDAALVENLELAAGAAHPSRTAEVFTGTWYEARLLSDVVGMSAFRRVGGKPHWVLPRPGGAVSLVAAKDEESAKAPLRLLREFLLREAEEELVLHGAAVADADGAVLLLGPSGSGKSTLALTVAERCGLALVGKDYLFVRRGERSAFEVSALPVVYRLGVGTIRGSAAWTDVLSSLGALRPGIVCPRDSCGEKPDAYGSSLKYEIPPAKVAEVLGCDVAAVGDIRVVVLSRMEPGDRPMTLFEVDPTEALAQARAELRVPVGAPWLLPWVAPRRREPIELCRRAETRLGDLLACSRVFSLRVGVKWFATRQQIVAERLVAAREAI